MARAHALYMSDLRKISPHKWDAPNGPELTLSVREVDSADGTKIKLTSAVNEEDDSSIVGSFDCDMVGGCEVLVNTRTDGRAIVRFENVVHSSNPGEARVWLLKWDEEHSRLQATKTWKGTAHEYWSDEAPDWTTMRREE